MRLQYCAALLAGLIAAWPLGTIAQVSAVPVVGFLHAQSAEPGALDAQGLREGLKNKGFIEGPNGNVVIETRWGNSKADTLAALADELVRLRVTVIATAGGMRAATEAFRATGEAAKATNTTPIPVVFVTGLDPTGLVESFKHPGGNATGVYNFNKELVLKRLEDLRTLVGAEKKIAFMFNGDDTNFLSGSKNQVRDDDELASRVTSNFKFNAATEPEIRARFKQAVEEGAGALFVGSDPFYTAKRSLFVELAAEYSLPASYQQREFVDAGGLISYGPNGPASVRQVGEYVGLVLRGQKPADMPVLSPTDFDFVINLTTAKRLGVTVPPSFRARAELIGNDDGK
jgi:putative ABC transport system substrate-binding protein